MGFAFLAQTFGSEEYHQRAVHFLEVLQETRCRDYEDYCWGYPFDWETRTGTMKEGTPLITTLPYVYEAFSQVYALDKDPKWLQIMHSIAEHAATSYRDMEIAPDTAACGYTPAPDDPCRSYQRQRLSGVSSDQGRHRALGTALSGDREKKPELRAGVSKRRRILVLFNRRRERFC